MKNSNLLTNNNMNFNQQLVHFVCYNDIVLVTDVFWLHQHLMLYIWLITIAITALTFFSQKRN